MLSLPLLEKPSPEKEKPARRLPSWLKRALPRGNENFYTHNRIVLPKTGAYVTNVLSTRVSYSFSPELFVKSFVQYNDATRTASLNLLFWYIWRPGSNFYIVYNQGWETDVPGPRDLRTRGRSLAVKFTYWLSR